MKISRANWSQGLFCLNAVANPVVERPHRGRAQLAAGDQQQIGPFVGPVIDKLIAFEKCVDQLRALVGRLVGEEVLDFFGGGQNAGGIEESAADESGIARSRPRAAMFRLFHFASTKSSMKLLARKLRVSLGGNLIRIRRRQRRVEHAAGIPERDRPPRPMPFILTWPLSSTVATPSLFELNFTQRVTSAVLPSEYFALHLQLLLRRRWRASPASGRLPSATTSLSFGDGGGVPAAIHSAMIAIFERIRLEALAAAVRRSASSACGESGCRRARRD